MKKAVENVNEIIAPEIIGLDAVEQTLIDRIMIDLDGTQNKGRLGANAVLGYLLLLPKQRHVPWDCLCFNI